MKRLNRWLIVLLIATAIKQVIFVTLIPVWEVPDEPAHVAYVESIVTERRWPVFSGERMNVSREMLASLTDIEDSNPRRIGRHYPPGFLEVPDENRKQLVNQGEPIFNLAARNSPLYYLYEVIPAVLTPTVPIADKVLLMRLVTALLVVPTVWLAVQAARRMIASNELGFAVGAAVAFHPTVTALFSGVNPDSALTLVVMWVWWLLVQPVHAANVWPRSIYIALGIGMAASLKSPGWFLVGPAFLWWLWQSRQVATATWIKIGLVSALVMTLIGGGWLFFQHQRTPTELVDFFGGSRQPLTWQRILDNDLWQRPVIIWRTWWGHVGWSGVSRYNQPWVYVVALGMVALTSVGLLRAWRHRRWRIPRAAWLMIIGALTLEIMYQVLYWRAGLYSGMSHFPTHGRYYLPLILPLTSALVLGGAALFPMRYRVVGAMIVFSFMVLATTILGFQAWSLYSFERAAGW